MTNFDSAAKPILAGFFEKSLIETIEVSICKVADFVEKMGFCSSINYTLYRAHYPWYAVGCGAAGEETKMDLATLF